MTLSRDQLCDVQRGPGGAVERALVFFPCNVGLLVSDLAPSATCSCGDTVTLAQVQEAANG